MPVSSPPSRVVKSRKAKADRTRPAARDSYGYEMRWPRRRGHYEIETQCVECKWWFDTFNPDARKCRICEPFPPVETTKAPETPAPMTTEQHDQAPQTPSNPPTWSGAPGDTTQLPWGTLPAHEAGSNNTQYQSYSQDLGASLVGPVHSPGMGSSPPVGYLSNQLWGQDYIMSPTLPYSDGSNLSLMGGYIPNGPYEQGYNMSSSPVFYPTTSPTINPSMFTPSQELTQGYNTAMSSPFIYTDPAQTQTQTDDYYPQPPDTSGLGITMSSQEASEGSRANHQPQTAVSNLRPLRPLRPLLPRETPLGDTASTEGCRLRKGRRKANSISKPAKKYDRSSDKQKLVAIAPKPDDNEEEIN